MMNKTSDVPTVNWSSLTPADYEQAFFRRMAGKGTPVDAALGRRESQALIALTRDFAAGIDNGFKLRDDAWHAMLRLPQPIFEALFFEPKVMVVLAGSASGCAVPLDGRLYGGLIVLNRAGSSDENQRLFVHELLHLYLKHRPRDEAERVRCEAEVGLFLGLLGFAPT
jgi:hypothetical protein